MHDKPTHLIASLPSSLAGPKTYSGRNTFRRATDEQLAIQAARIEAELIALERETRRALGDKTEIRTIEDVRYH